MEHIQLVNAITDGFPSLTLPKQLGKPEYASFQDSHCLLTATVASIESPCVGRQNVHIGHVMTATQYAFVSQLSFVHQTDPGRTPTIPALITPFDKKALICDHTEQCRQYDECCNVDNALHNQLLTAVEYT